MTASDIFREHIDELTRRAEHGDQDALKSIMIIALLNEGWRYDPEETNVIELKSYKTRAKKGREA